MEICLGYDNRLVVIKDESPAIQLKAYKAVFYSLKLGDTATIIDIDEFVDLKGLTAREFINKNMMDCDCLKLSWQVYGDCGNVRYEAKPVLERFKTPAPIDCVFNRDLPQGITENWHTKFIIRKTWKPSTLEIHHANIQFGITRNVLRGNSRWK